MKYVKRDGTGFRKFTMQDYLNKLLMMDVRFWVLKSSFSYISVISWCSVLLIVEPQVHVMIRNHCSVTGN